MSLQDLGNLGEFVGAIAVVVSLVYLAAQIRQNTDSNKASAYEHVALSALDLNARLAQEEDLNRLFSSGVRDPGALSPQDRIRLTFVLYALFGNFEFIFLQHERSLIEPDAWERWSRTIAWYIAQPGVRSWWDAQPVPFDRRFSRFVEEQAIPAGIDESQLEKFVAFVGAAATERHPDPEDEESRPLE